MKKLNENMVTDEVKEWNMTVGNKEGKDDKIDVDHTQRRPATSPAAY
jgi:hypothetical protein